MARALALVIEEVNLRREIIIRYAIDEDKREVGSIIRRIGFSNEITSQYAIVGVLYKILDDEKEKLNKMLKVRTEYNVQGPVEDNGSN